MKPKFPSLMENVYVLKMFGVHECLTAELRKGNDTKEARHLASQNVTTE